MDDVVDTYELSPMQQGMLFHAVSSQGTGVDIEQITVTLREPLDLATFEQAWRDVIERHPVLRTRFRWQGIREPCQEVLAQAELTTTMVDWGDLAQDEAERRYGAHLRVDRQRGIDLAQAPTMRLFLALLPDGQTRVLWSVHHALLDGRSFAIVLRELFDLYDATRRGETSSLPPARPYHDYIAWRRSLDLSTSEAFWRTALHAFHTPTPFAIDALRSGDSRDRPYDVCQQRLSRALSGQLRDAARHADVTVNTMLQAAWAVLLHRYSGESDVVFGATRAGRSTGFADADEMVGLFINTLPMRVCVDDDAQTVPWLRSLRSQQIALRLHEHTPLATVQAWSAVARGTPLFESVVVYDHETLDARMQMPGRHFEDIGQSNFPLALTAYGDEEMLLRLEYSTERFSDAAMERMLAHLVNILTQLAHEDSAYVRDLVPVSFEERTALVGDEPSPPDVTRDATLHAGFARQVAATPDAIAISFDTASGREQLSYAEVDRRAEAVAVHLRGLGVDADHVVGLRVERGPDLVIGIMAILKAGGAYLPLDPAYPTERIAFMLQDAAVRMVLTQRTLAAGLSALPVKCVYLDEPLPPTSAAPPLRPGSAEDLAYVMYTSGSTGRPNGVPITHDNVLRMFAATAAWDCFGPSDVFTLFASCAFDASVWEMWGALLFGGRLVIVSHDTNRDPAAFRALLLREQVTVLSQTPTAFNALIDADRAAPPGAYALRYIALGGEALQLQSLQPWFDRYGDETPRVINLYGPTETTVQVAYRRITQADLHPGVGSLIGSPIPGTQIYLLDAFGRPVPIGVAGELYIAGAGVAEGYLQRPDLTAKRFVPNPFHGGHMYRSGDLARRLENGDLEYLGRIDQQVKIRGFRIELGEIEAAIADHPVIRQVAVIDREDEPGDKKLVAYVVADDPPETVISDLREALRTRLPDYMIPAQFVFLDALPLTTNDKLDRKALPEPEYGRGQISRAYVAPRNSAEETIADVWKAVLRVDEVGVDDPFFELGGHSLLLVRVHEQLKDKVRANLPITALLQYPTVRTLARHLAGEGTGPASTVATVDRARRQREALARQRNLTGRC